MKKNEFLQIVRGISIICVVIIHSLTQNVTNEQINIANIIIRQIINFPVAVFIFLSGYLVNIEKIEKNKLQYYKDRFIRLFIPFIIYSILYAIFKIILKSEEINLKIIPKILIGSYSAQLYYIIVLLQLVLITPLLIKIIKNENRILNVMCILVSPIYISILFYFNVFEKISINNYHIPFFAWLIFYYLGLKIHIKGQNKNIMGYFVFPLLIVSLILGVFLYNKGISYNFCISQVTIVNMLYSISIIMLILRLNNREYEKNILTKLGDKSFGIFFIHMFYITIFKRLIIFHNYFISQIIIIVLTLSFSYASILIFKKITKNKFDKILAL